MSQDDAFEKIIKDNNLGHLYNNDEVSVTIREIHHGVSSLSEAAMYLTDFVIEFFECTASGDPLPSLTEDSVRLLKMALEAVKSFNDSIFDEDEEEEDE